MDIDKSRVSGYLRSHFALGASGQTLDRAHRVGSSRYVYCKAPSGTERNALVAVH